VSTHFLRQPIEFVLNESLDLGFPRRGIGVLRVTIFRTLVSLIEVVT